MGSKKSRQRHNRRDRRKAKASGYRREGTKNPRKKGHHAYDALAPGPAQAREPAEERSPAQNVVWTCPKCDTKTIQQVCPTCGLEKHDEIL